MSKLYTELTEKVGVTPEQGEAYPIFAERLCDAISKLDDDKYNALSDEARQYFDDCIDPINKKQPDKLPELEGFPVPGAAAAPAEPKAESVAEAPAPAAKPSKAKAEKADAKHATKAAAPAVAKAKPAAKPAPAAPKAKPAAKAAAKPATKPAKKAEKPAEKTAQRGGPGSSGPKVKSVAYRLRRMVILKPTISFEDACEKIGAKPVRRSHAWNVWYTAFRIMKIVLAEGYVKPK